MKNDLPSVHLEFREGTSDKEYNAWVEEAATNKYVVNFSFGRREGTLQTGSKTSSPVSFESACDTYTKLVHSKTVKGYKEVGKGGGKGSVVVTNQDKEDTGLRPQLLNPITEDEGVFPLLDESWCGQEKYDGKRMTFRKAGKTVIASNKLGWKIGFPQVLNTKLAEFGGNFVVDGECVGETLYLFDMLESQGMDLREKPYMERYKTLLDKFSGAGANIVVAPTAIGAAAKKAMLKELKANGKEGMVFKSMDSHWYAGRPNSGGSALKMKFWSSASCVVSKVNAKRSIKVSLGGKDMGNVTIPPSKPVPEVGQVVEIKYLYVAGVGGSLYQPIYIGPRDDVDADECTIEKQHLKYKGEGQEDEMDYETANAIASALVDEDRA